MTRNRVALLRKSTGRWRASRKASRRTSSLATAEPARTMRAESQSSFAGGRARETRGGGSSVFSLESLPAARPGVWRQATTAQEMSAAREPHHCEEELVRARGFEPPTTGPQSGALPGC